jgi:hypothetical protein
VTVGLRPPTLPDPSQLAAPEGRGDGYQHPLSGAGARRQGAREGGDALECTCAELAHPQGARRGAVFRRLSDPVRRDIVAATCAAAAASKGRRRRRRSARGCGASTEFLRVPRARRLTDWRLSAPHLRRSLPFHRSIVPSPYHYCLCVCQSRAACRYPLVRLVFPPASVVWAYCAGNGACRMQQLTTSAQLCFWCPSYALRILTAQHSVSLLFCCVSRAALRRYPWSPSTLTSSWSTSAAALHCVRGVVLRAGDCALC